ncbi:IS1 family transposase [Zooshikella ganghwensis]|uniref:IS1 family transposase n=1 Tax=Zooshikella ganghwensis TaxID=202772 RepID=UPI003B8A9564
MKKIGYTPEGKQRYLCKSQSCKKSFILDYSNKAYQPGVKETIIDMTMNGSGIRDIARVLGISRNTVIDTIKKRGSELHTVNKRRLENLEKPSKTRVKIKKVLVAEVDEMWSFVNKKTNQRWFWHAIDAVSGDVLAYVLDTRQDKAFIKLKSLLKPFGIKLFCTDDWGAYSRHIPEENHVVGKRNTQKIERKHLTLRTRIKRLCRKTICFSKSDKMHDIVIGIFINRYEFGRNT